MKKYKRLKYWLMTGLITGSFWLYLGLPLDFKYFGLVLGSAITIFSWWFGLGILWGKYSLRARLSLVILPVLWYWGWGISIVVLPVSFWWQVGWMLILASGIYISFLASNIFLVVIGFRTVPLYRSAYTVALILVLFSEFMIFNGLLAYGFDWWLVWIMAGVVFWMGRRYVGWVVAVEREDDGKTLPMSQYLWLSWLVAMELMLVLFWWPMGIFRRAMYLVLIEFWAYSLLEPVIRERMFRRSWTRALYVGLGIVVGLFLQIKWRF